MKSLAPVFLVGSVRSGSTFLRLMLDAHPFITNPGECDFLIDLVDDGGRYPSLDEYHRFLAANRIFLAKGLAVDVSHSYPALMRSFLDQFQRDDAVLVMNLHRHFHRVPRVFPEARYIHLIRDPRDVARSCMAMGWAGNAYRGVDIWVEAERSWDRLKNGLREDQYLEIRYEDLLDDIEAGLARICHFLGLEYSARMLDYAANSTYGQPDKNLSQQWKTKYSAHELRLVEGRLGQVLVDRGYESSGHEPCHPGVIERLLLLANDKRYRIGHRINRYGFALYLKNLVASYSGLRDLQHACQRQINLIDLQHLK
jgi:LPS sulfotransferase NodH